MKNKHSHFPIDRERKQKNRQKDRGCERHREIDGLIPKRSTVSCNYSATKWKNNKPLKSVLLFLQISITMQQVRKLLYTGLMRSQGLHQYSRKYIEVQAICFQNHCQLTTVHYIEVYQNSYNEMKTVTSIVFYRCSPNQVFTCFGFQIHDETATLSAATV